MKTIWKYPIDMTEEQTVRMPKGARVLCAKLQGKTVCLWALVDRAPEGADDSARYTTRRVRVRGTDHDCTGVDPSWYVDTVLVRMETLVFHIFVEPAAGVDPGRGPFGH